MCGIPSTRPILPQPDREHEPPPREPQVISTTTTTIRRRAFKVEIFDDGSRVETDLTPRRDG